ncbi:2079_t:CDS:1, partial [Funneliformis mosseae]
RSTHNTLYDLEFAKDTTDNNTKTMCCNEDIRDAIDDVCGILSKWNDRLIYEYNKGLHESYKISSIKQRSADQKSAR